LSIVVARFIPPFYKRAGFIHAPRVGAWFIGQEIKFVRLSFATLDNLVDLVILK